MSKILDAQDILGDARGCIECIFMAGSEFTEEGRNPIQTVADTASTKIDEAIALLSEYRESVDAPVPAAPSAKPKSRAARTKTRTKRRGK